jgi:hypothetical protein
MPKNAIKYTHPVHGEIWIQRGSEAHTMYEEKNWFILNNHLSTHYLTCYPKKK